MSGLSVMPVVNRDSLNLFTDFYSKFSHDSEKVSPGHHYLKLDRNNIEVELTSTKRVGFHKYDFQDEDTEKRAILFNLHTPLGPCHNSDGILKMDGNMELSGSLLMQLLSEGLSL